MEKRVSRHLGFYLMSTSFFPPADIVIISRNRETDLIETLQKINVLRKEGLCHVRVFDDCSNQVTPGYFEKIAALCDELHRDSQPLSYIVRRNRAFSSSLSSWIFSLDDDSHFIDLGAVPRALEYLEAHPQVAALSFPVHSTLPTTPPSLIPPYPCRSFVGCAFLIRKSVFVELGGFCEAFIHQGEETELALRLWQAGYEIHAFPACRVIHRVSLENRNWKRMGYFGPRNRVWTLFLRYPARKIPLELVQSFASYAKLSIRTGLAHIHLKGWLAGLFQGIRHWSKRNPLSTALFQYWKNLPPDAGS